MHTQTPTFRPLLGKILLIFALLLPPLHNAVAGNEEQRIQAVSEFLVERAEANLMYSFENRLKKNQDLECYFPATYDYVSRGDLRLLITARGEWQRVLQNDIETLVVRAFAHELARSLDLSRAGINATNAYLEMVEFIDVSYQGGLHPINFIPLDSTPELRALINGFYDDFLRLRDEFDATDNMLAGFSGDDPCTMPQLSTADFNGYVERLGTALQGMQGLSQHFAQHGGKLRFNSQRMQEACAVDGTRPVCQIRERAVNQWLPELKEKLNKPVLKVAAVAAALARYIEQTRDDVENYTARVLRVTELLKNGMKEPRLVRLKNNILFFARLADANTKEEAKAVLQEYTLPPVSFMIKRQPPGESHWLLSSYFGYAGGKTTDGVNKDEGNHGMFVPLGLEYSRALGSGNSLSLMLAPFDFGYPVSMQINGSEQKASLDQIVAPSLSLSYGLADYPLVIGLSYQQGRDVLGGDTREKRAMLFFAFDMPLLQLY